MFHRHVADSTSLQAGHPDLDPHEFDLDELNSSLYRAVEARLLGLMANYLLGCRR